MKYDLIALDLDGTALNPQNEVTRVTVRSVAKAREAGCRVVVATGRISGEAAEFARALGADDYMITSGGATISDARDGRCLMRVSIPWEPAVRAAAVLERIGLSTMVYIGEHLFVTRYDEEEFGKYKSNEGYLSSKVVVPSIAERVAAERLCVDKLFTRSLDPALLENARRQLEQIEGLRVISSAPDNLEVVSPAADKGTALRMLCKLYGVKLSRTAAVGDSENDLEMLQTAKVGIVMGNASPKLLKQFKNVTTDNAHDGAATAIEWMLGRTTMIDAMEWIAECEGLR